MLMNFVTITHAKYIYPFKGPPPPPPHHHEATSLLDFKTDFKQLPKKHLNILQ